MWAELKEAGLEDVIHAAIYEGQIMLMQIYTNREGNIAIPIAILTDAQVMAAAREVVEDGEYYKKLNLDQMRSMKSPYPNDPHNRAITHKMQVVLSMSPIECVINLPKFIRLCIELLDRGYLLEDIFYDGKPN